MRRQTGALETLVGILYLNLACHHLRGSRLTLLLPAAGDEALRPLSCPINVSFRCTLEAMGPYGSPFAAATFTGGSFMRPGEWVK